MKEVRELASWELQAWLVEKGVWGALLKRIEAAGYQKMKMGKSKGSGSPHEDTGMADMMSE